MKPIPPGFSRESFWGFDMKDTEVGPGACRHVAIEIKHAFEGMVREADERNEEFFLPIEVEHALRRFLVDPSQSSLDYLLEVSPALAEPVKAIRSLVTPSMFATLDTQQVNEPICDVPEDCDLDAAAEELRELIGMAATQATEDGGNLFCEPEYHQATKAFLDQPTRRNARTLLKTAPTREMMSLFVRHTPRGRTEYDNCAQSGGAFGLKLWRFIVDDSKAFHHSHKDYIEHSQSDFVLEELCAALHVVDRLLGYWSPSDHQPFTTSALVVIASCFESEFGHAAVSVPFLKVATDRLHEYSELRFGGEEIDALAGSFRWESSLKILGSPHPNPGTLMAYVLQNATRTKMVSELLQAHLLETGVDLTDAHENGSAQL